MIKYCANCDKMVESSFVTQRESYSVKGQHFDVDSKIFTCSVCGAELWDDDSADESLRTAFNMYRKQNHLLMPDEIKQIRLNYDLSQSAFAKILGVGEKTITRYENGSLQDMAQNNLLLMMRESKNFLLLWEQNKHLLAPHEIVKTEQKLVQKPPFFKFDNVIYLPPCDSSIKYKFNMYSEFQCGSSILVSGGVQ